jgi:hypothetical protein
MTGPIMCLNCDGTGEDEHGPCDLCAATGWIEQVVEECRKCDMPVAVTYYGRDRCDGWRVRPVFGCRNEERCGEKTGGRTLWPTRESRA